MCDGDSLLGRLACINSTNDKVEWDRSGRATIRLLGGSAQQRQQGAAASGAADSWQCTMHCQQRIPGSANWTGPGRWRERACIPSNPGS